MRNHHYHNGQDIESVELRTTANQFYDSIRVDVPDNYRSLDQEIRLLCNTLELYISTNNPRIDLVMNTLRLKHPIFKLITIGAFNLLIEKSFLFRLAKDQGAYKEGLKAMNNIYIILYGEFKLE